MKASALLLSALAVILVGCAYPVEKKTVVKKEAPVVYKQKEVVVQQPSTVPPNCSYGGTVYRPDALSCQGGFQYRCDDGAWVSRARSC